ncbi:hypothetical protein BC940DRAFT_287697 [Gongronella butleri]|nr:hypothetical protein BC940DRAFT_287697 [Gongronella butleri]
MAPLIASLLFFPNLLFFLITPLPFQSCLVSFFVSGQTHLFPSFYYIAVIYCHKGFPSPLPFLRPPFLHFLLTRLMASQPPRSALVPSYHVLFARNITLFSLLHTPTRTQISMSPLFFFKKKKKSFP